MLLHVEATLVLAAYVIPIVGSVTRTTGRRIQMLVITLFTARPQSNKGSQKSIAKATKCGSVVKRGAGSPIGHRSDRHYRP